MNRLRQARLILTAFTLQSYLSILPDKSYNCAAAFSGVTDLFVVTNDNFIDEVEVEWPDGPIIVSVRLKGKNLEVKGFNFRDDDDVELNGQRVKNVRFKSVVELLLKKIQNKILVCDPQNPPKNQLRVFRNPNTNPGEPIQDTSAFATCP